MQGKLSIRPDYGYEGFRPFLEQPVPFSISKNQPVLSLRRISRETKEWQLKGELFFYFYEETGAEIPMNGKSVVERNFAQGRNAGIECELNSIRV